MPKNTSEDCLLVNVYAPILSDPTAKVPVMVWFNGGAFVEGSNIGPFGLYNGSYMASTHNVVIVAVNYRLGAFGYAVLGNGVNGNQGFLDQRFALQWVQANAALFGGDSSAVTAWGESAGAMSIGLHLVSPGSKGLFQRAIMESNPSGINYKTLDEALVYGNTFCANLNCSSSNVCDLACVQQASEPAVTDAWNKAGDDVIDFLIANWGHIIDGFLSCTPTIDGVEIPQEPLHALAAGAYATDVQILVGTNTNEGATFIYDAVDFELPPFLYSLALDVVFGSANAAQIQALPRYNPASYSDGRQVLGYMLTDYWFRCASEKFAAAAVAHGVPAYVYRYDHLFSGASIFPQFGLPAICTQDVCHASEIPFVFHNDVPSLNVTFTPDELVLATRMDAYWASFAKFGSPNKDVPAGTPIWPAWNATRVNVVLNTTITLETSQSLCTFWDSLGYDF